MTEKTSAYDRYQRHKDRAAARSAANASAGRDIGNLPPVRNPARKAAGAAHFRTFAETYFPNAFTLAWSPDHLKVIRKGERAVKAGGLFAIAMPRGSGKTTLVIALAIWALLTGRHRYVALIAATAAKGEDLLDSIKTEFETNELLLEDYPEAVYPIRSLERIHNRAHGQLYHGRPTRMVWTASKIVLPTIAGSRASGAVVTATGLEGGGIRGQQHRTDQGEILRPSLAVLDDPQTTETALSELQSRRREALLSGDVLGMAGPGRKIAALCCMTVIRPGDMADAILDRDRHPEWAGERTKLIYTFAAREDLWTEYARIRSDELKSDGDGSQATEFYRAHREEMDRGAVVAWAERHNPDELSALQHAMNLLYRDRAAFYAEYQNEPLPDVQADQALTHDDVERKINGYRRGQIPGDATTLTAFVDVHAAALYYTVAAWAEGNTGWIVDYGTYPKTRRMHYTLRDFRPTMQQVAEETGLEGAIWAGLQVLTDELLSQEWERDDGAAMRIDRLMIDANWGEQTDLVYRFCRNSTHAARILPSHGHGVKATGQPFSEHKRQPGEKIGPYWRIPSVVGKRAIRHAVYDTNYWKSFVYSRLATKPGDPGALTLFRSDGHRLYAEHVCAEYPVRVEARKRVVYEWQARPNRDNHFFDTLVGCAVAASIEGIRLPEAKSPRVKRFHKPRSAITF